MTERPQRAGFLSGVRLMLQEGVDTGVAWRRMWAAGRRTFGLIVGTGTVAVAVSFFMPRWYQSGATLVVDPGQGAQASLAGAAGMLGVTSQLGFGGATGTLNPLFYEALLKSRTVADHVITAHFPLGPHGELRTLEQYWSDEETPTAKEHIAAEKRFAHHLETTATPRTQQVVFKIAGPSELVAKLMADTVLAALNDLVVEIRQQHAHAERAFLEARFQALADSLRAREDVLRHFYEQNRNLSSPELQFEDARLRREVERVQAVYAQVGTQLEQARIQEVRDTPALTVVDVPIEPVRKSAPHGSLWGLTGALLAGALAFLLAMAETANLQVQALRLQPPGLRRSEQG